MPWSLLVYTLNTFSELFSYMLYPCNFIQHQEEKPATPCVAYTGSSVEDSQELFVLVERHQLFRVIDSTDAIVATMGSYWIFNLAYARKTDNLCCILEHLFLGVSVSKPRCAARRFISAHKTAFCSSVE